MRPRRSFALLAAGCRLLLVVLLATPAAATISSSTNKTIVAGNGTQTQFTFNFVADSSADIDVIYTDASGNQTTLTQGPGPAQFQVSLNSAIAPSLWGVGGTVTYNPNGAPIGAGTTLTIYRTLPLTQPVSLQNQASYGQFAQASETGLDQLEMQIQQLAEAQARVLSAPIVDPSSIVMTLPAAAQRASMALCFDPTGAPIACSVAPGGIISSVMAPVVGAASLAAARQALGIGTGTTVAISATGSITAAQLPATFECNAAAGSVVITVPAAAAGLGDATFLRSDSSANTCAVAVSGGGTMAGLALLSLNTQNQSHLLRINAAGTAWDVIQ